MMFKASLFGVVGGGVFAMLAAMYVMPGADKSLIDDSAIRASADRQDQPHASQVREDSSDLIEKYVKPFDRSDRDAPATDDDDDAIVGYRVVAREGTLSDFWGDATHLTEGLWLIENANGISVIVESGRKLTAYHRDGRDPSVAVVEGNGTPEQFMTLLLPSGAVAGDPPKDLCGSCNSQSCCNTHYEQGSPAWCVCTSQMICEHGVCSINPVTCQIDCCELGK